MQNFIKTYQNYLKIRGLSPRTIKIYKSILIKYLAIYPNPKQVNQPQIVEFMLQRGQSRTIKQTHGALNHFYKGVLNLNAIKKIPQPKSPVFVPNILTEYEANLLINNIKNLKHEAIIQLIYSCALRVSEALNLKVSDISKFDNNIKIVAAKGNKTSYVPIPEPTKNLLRLYYYHYKPKVYLFEGSPGKKYSVSSVRKILNKNLKSVGIFKKIRIHDLRHSRATHLLQNGMDIKILKDILRHKKLDTTERYLHLTTKTLETAMLKADQEININLNQYKQLNTNQNVA